jgi:hypothetical protein
VSDFETRFEELKASADTLEAEARNLGTWTCDPTPENTAWRERVERDLRECSEGLPVNLRDDSDFGPVFTGKFLGTKYNRLRNRLPLRTHSQDFGMFLTLPTKCPVLCRIL